MGMFVAGSNRSHQSAASVARGANRCVSMLVAVHER
jgi:hypothetical protein